jgi:hypothetical protein
LTNQNGFILPVTLFVSTLLIAFVFHAIFLMASDRNFFQSSYAHFQIQQLRENALAEIGERVRSTSLPESGHFSYDSGTVTFTALKGSDQVAVTFTVYSGQNTETDRIIYRLPDGQPVTWFEKANP